MTLKRFMPGQRVFVARDFEGHEIGALGTVRRLRKADDGAWIALDVRHERCPFPAAESRGTHIMAYPADCEAA